MLTIFRAIYSPSGSELRPNLSRGWDWVKTARDSSEEKVKCTGSNSTYYRLVLSQDITGTSRVLVNGQVTVDQSLLINLEIPYQPSFPHRKRYRWPLECRNSKLHVEQAVWVLNPQKWFTCFNTCFGAEHHRWNSCYFYQYRSHRCQRTKRK